MSMSLDSSSALPDMPDGGPDIKVSVRQTFGIDSDMQVPGFSQESGHVPDLDEAYFFDRDTTLAILAGFAYNRRVIIQGYHGGCRHAINNWPNGCIRTPTAATSRPRNTSRWSTRPIRS